MGTFLLGGSEQEDELLFAKCKCVILELERDGEGWFDMKWLEDEIIAII